MRISVHPGPPVVNLQAIYYKHDRPAVRRVIRTLAIAELFAQGIPNRLTFVTAFWRRVQFVSYLFAGSRRSALLFSTSRRRFRTAGGWTRVMLRRWRGARCLAAFDPGQRTPVYADKTEGTSYQQERLNKPHTYLLSN